MPDGRVRLCVKEGPPGYSYAPGEHFGIREEKLSPRALLSRYTGKNILFVP